MKSQRVLFAGTPEFALASLKALVEAGVRPVAVLTQPDRPAGRGKKLTASPVKRYAEDCDLPVLQPPSLRDDAVQAQLAALEPDLMVVAAYGLILPQAVLDIPRLGCLNVHASMLPRWRGAAPIQAAILAGDTETGISLMQMEAGLDTGPVFVSSTLGIGEQDTAGDLHDRLAALGGQMLKEHLPQIIAGELKPVAQDDSLASYAPKIEKRDAKLDWQLDASTLARRVRAYNPVPGAWFEFEDMRIKVWRARPLADVDAPAGTVTAVGDSIIVACRVGALALDALQRPGKRPVSAAEFSQSLQLVGCRLT